jgi:hypothetical protein
VSYLEALSEEEPSARRIIPCVCPCGSTVFYLDADEVEGCARRTCVRCGVTAWLADSEEFWEEADPIRCTCPTCGGEEHEVAVLFYLRDDGEVRWITVGERCVRCGVLSTMAEWKIDHAPTDHLFSQV